jgi:hypothetical protein
MNATSNGNLIPSGSTFFATKASIFSSVASFVLVSVAVARDTCHAPANVEILKTSSLWSCVLNAS